MPYCYKFVSFTMLCIVFGRSLLDCLIVHRTDIWELLTKSIMTDNKCASFDSKRIFIRYLLGLITPLSKMRIKSVILINNSTFISIPKPFANTFPWKTRIINECQLTIQWRMWIYSMKNAYRPFFYRFVFNAFYKYLYILFVDEINVLKILNWCNRK